LRKEQRKTQKSPWMVIPALGAMEGAVTMPGIVVKPLGFTLDADSRHIPCGIVENTAFTPPPPHLVRFSNIS
jgi:hypothetical protein